MKKKDYFMLFGGLYALIASLCFKEMFSTISLGQTIYHLKVPMEGASIQIFLAFLGRSIPITLIIGCLFIIIFYNYHIKPIRIKKIQIFPLYYLKKYLKPFLLVMLAICFISMCFYLDAGTYLINQFRKTTLYDNYYVDSSKVTLTFPSKKRNLIYIFVESLENTYASKDVGGNQTNNLMPELSSLALENTNFSNSTKLGGAYQVGNTDWTASALVSQTSGLPVNLALLSKKYDKNETFFPNIATIGTVLEDNGYKNVFMLGSDANFGERKSYFVNHGNYEILDLDGMKDKGLLDKDYHTWWGYEDNKLFEFAKDELKELSSSNQPFNLTLLTADTHFIDGYLESDCEKKYDNHISNVIACSSNKITDFVNWIKEQDFYDNTTIVISGDHLYMDSYYFDSDYYTRTVYNVFVNSAITSDTTKDRSFSTLDMFPTTLASLGVNIEGDRLGLGTNLFSNKKTIIEEMGLSNFRREILKKSDLYNTLLKGN